MKHSDEEIMNSNHKTINQKAAIVLPAFFEELNPEKVKTMLKTLDGRIEIRETLRDFIRELKIIRDRV